jgi:hypothetical protein
MKVYSGLSRGVCVAIVDEAKEPARAAVLICGRLPSAETLKKTLDDVGAFVERH